MVRFVGGGSDLASTAARAYAEHLIVHFRALNADGAYRNNSSFDHLHH
jgi:hypothetical protein